MSIKEAVKLFAIFFIAGLWGIAWAYAGDGVVGIVGAVLITALFLRLVGLE